MDATMIDMFSRLVHTGGQGALIVLVWVGSKIANRAHDALHTLQRIEQALIADRATNAASQVSTANKLDSIHDDLQALPLNLLRTTRGNR